MKSIIVVPHVHSVVNIEYVKSIDDISKKYDFVFYAINSDSPRKNLEELIRSFKIMNIESSCLYIKTGKSNYKSEKNVIIDETLYSDSEIQYIHEKFDCFVNTSFSEGVGLGMLDASSKKSFVITNSYGGQIEYLPFGFYVNYCLTNVEDDYYYFQGLSSKWARVNSEHLRDVMRFVYDTRLKLQSVLDLQDDFCKERFSEHTIGNLLAKSLIC